MFSWCGFRSSRYNVFQRSKIFDLFRLNNCMVCGRGNSSSKVTVKKSERKQIAKLLSFAKPVRRRIIGGVILLFVSSSVTLSVPFCMGKVIDFVFSSDNKEIILSNLRSFSAGLLCVFAIGGLANAGRVYLINTAGQRVVHRLRQLLFGSIVKQEIAFFDKNATGELINRLSADTQLVGNSVTQNISDGLRSSCQAIGGIGLMIYVCPLLATKSLFIVPPIAALGIIYGRYVRRITKEVQDSLAGSTQFSEERVANIRTVRAFAQENHEIQEYNTHVTKVLDLSYKEAIAKALFFGTAGFAGNVIALSVFYHGGLMTLTSSVTIGDLAAFLVYAVTVGASLAGLSSFYTELMRGSGASARILELIERVPAIPTPMHPSDLGVNQTMMAVAGNLEFESVSFSYPTRTEIDVLNNFSLKIPAGTMTAIVGASGSGKSTLASLLLRFYDPSHGSILIDGEKITAFDVGWLRRQIGLVSQEPVLFSASIRENILYGLQSEDSENNQNDQLLLDACKQANALNFIEDFPQKLNTVVGERGVMLSGGQRQRLAIARAVIKNPKILILDEATSALDAESEYLVQDAIEKIMADRTVLTIAHRLSTIRNANQIAVIDEGSIVELGTYDELMANSGPFKKLVERQTFSMNTK